MDRGEQKGGVQIHRDRTSQPTSYSYFLENGGAPLIIDLFKMQSPTGMLVALAKTVSQL